MKLAFIDTDGCLVSVATRVQQEGHRVLYWAKADEEATAGEGIVPKATTLKQILAFTPDAVVCYQCPEIATTLRGLRVPSWGSSPMAASLEEDRMAAARLAEGVGIAVPETQAFTSMDAALRFLAQTDQDAWVFKASGGPEVECSQTHVTKTKDELRSVIDFEGRVHGATDFILQEVVEGVEISTEGWYDYRVGWLRPFNATLERKALMAGDTGPMAGAMGSIVWAWPDDRLADLTVKRMTRWLEKARYVGPLDINTILDHETQTPWFLEFTPRLGWDAFEALMAGIDEGALGPFCVALARGEADTVPVDPDVYMAAIRYYMPAVPDAPILAPWRANRHLVPKNVWFDGQTLRSTGAMTDNGFSMLFEAIGTGRTIHEAVRPLYDRVILKIAAPGGFARPDIGEQAQRDVDTLMVWGYHVPGVHGVNIPSLLPVDLAMR